MSMRAGVSLWKPTPEYSAEDERHTWRPRLGAERSSMNTESDPIPADESPLPAGTHDEHPYKGTGVSWTLIIILVVVVIVAVLAAVNTAPVSVDLVFQTIQAPLISVVLVVAAVAVVVDELVGLAVRRSRRRRLHEKQQLAQLKKNAE
jgi:uncharacterized integral membrane protein